MRLARRLDKVRARIPAILARREAGQGTIVVAGDSLCGGRAPLLLSDALRRAGIPLNVVTVWRGGITIDRLTRHLATVATRTDQSRVRGVVVLVGGNEVKRGRMPSEAGLVSELNRTLDVIRSAWPDAFILLCTVPVPSGHPALRTDAQAVVAGVVNPSIRTVAAARGALLCELETLFCDVPHARSDGVHPTAVGDRMMAETWCAAMVSRREPADPSLLSPDGRAQRAGEPGGTWP